ncbi:methyltransferase [Streptomyces qinzhouensis]|uniref:SAM-dependent methyltransferase n=1 Tax=Streptomyces qinzhouensis TaxID=2599401 RepID=A0A5B8JGM2_9ACTN|nr:methyltransferase [Streptomyces qinzhouensis]QDY75172.1 SAM-dependent methyltransferase [Streptomyces qinzhouensis]QDY80626.1 SAM-dependent methyltransferase [Streptomyces qinzhouensis]
MSVAHRGGEAVPSSPDSRQEAGELLDLALGYLYSAALNSAARFGIADHLVIGPRTAGELAEATGAHAPHLYRLLRFLATKGVFREDETGRFHLTPLAQPLRTDAVGSLRDNIMVYSEAPFWEPAGRLHEAVRTGTTAFENQYGTPFYDYVATDREFGTAFNSSMAAASQALSNDIAEAFDFSRAKSVVDVGGGRGGLVRSVLLRNPHMTGTLFDLENVVAGHVLDTPDLAGRWRAESGDFFASVPAGADVYFLKHILASWPDGQCVSILRTCRDAMPAHGRLLVVNPMIPVGNEPHFGKTVDMLMMTVLNGRNRTRAEYEELLTEAGFEVVQFLEPSPHASVVEAAVAV